MNSEIDWDWSLRDYARIESEFWPKEYLPMNKLREAIWFALYCELSPRYPE